MLRGGLPGSRDWSLVNQTGVLKLKTSTDNFATSDDILSINTALNVGIGTTAPAARLHISGAEDASLTNDGYLMLGAKSGTNLIFDENSIMARNNGSPSALFIQSHGGNTHIGSNGGNIQIGGGAAGGDMGIGTYSPNARMTVNDDEEFQVMLRNNLDPDNIWYIGSSGSSWGAGDDQLLFNPGINSTSSTLRLLNTTDNNGSIAPVMIRSAGSQTLLLDGNEIDSRDHPLYFNSNSDHTTRVNSNGGRIGIGTNTTKGSLKIHTQPTDYAFIFEKYNVKWGLHPFDVTNQLGVIKDGVTMANIIGASGQWVAVSDRRLKEDIRPMYSVLDKLEQTKLYSYSFKFDETNQEHYGALAQELKDVFPELVHISDGQYSVAYEQLSVVALQALKEQSGQIEDLKAELESLARELQTSE